MKRRVLAAPRLDPLRDETRFAELLRKMAFD
jgi:hypothetical protein